MGEIETLQQSQAVTATTLRWLPLDAPCLGSWRGGSHLCYRGGKDVFSTAWYPVLPSSRFPMPTQDVFH